MQADVSAPAIVQLDRADARSRERFYDGIAESFDDVMNQYDVRRRLEVVFDQFLGGLDLRGQSLLDAGCGTGRFSEAAVRRGAIVTSVDIGPRLLSVTRDKCRTAQVCSDVTRLAFGDESFDVVVSSECIEHTPDPRAAVLELFRVCRPGGSVVITCPNRFWRWSLTVASALGLRVYDGLENWPTWRQLGHWVREGGGRIVRHVGIHAFPFVISTLNPILNRLDALGRIGGPFFVNQAILAAR